MPDLLRFNCETVFLRTSSSRPVIATVNPAETSSCAIARPIPRVPPVTIAVLFFRSAITSTLQPCPQSFVDDFGICFALRRLDHLAHKETKQGFLARAVVGNLIRIRSDHAVDERVDLARVAYLDQTLFFDDRLGRLSGLEHLDQN